jgi:hypothetical protein
MIPAKIGPNRSAWRRPVACRPMKNKKFADMSGRVPLAASNFDN